MTPTSCAPESVDAAEQVAQLRQILHLVEQIAGGPTNGLAAESAMNENARIISAYESAAPIVRRRFNGLAEETADWAARGVGVLLAARDDDDPPRAAAARLASELTHALRELGRILSA
jgi:hypothetical protein